MPNKIFANLFTDEERQAQNEMVANNPHVKLKFHEMVSKLEESTDKPGKLVVNCFEAVENQIPKCVQKMHEPLPMWQYMDSLQKRTCPLEKLLSDEELAKLTDEELRSYAQTVEYWRTLWWVQKYRHWHQEIRCTEIPGPKKDQTFWRCPPLSIPVQANVLDFDWDRFKESHRMFSRSGKLFDCIVTDPPWTLATEKSTRGVALNYDQITDRVLLNAVPFSTLMNDNGVIFMWVINAKLIWAIDWLENSGFKVVECITWLKMSSNRLMARGHGYYLQHAKEDCIVAVKGDTSGFNWENLTGSLVAEKRCQSQKPSDFYDMVEQFAPPNSSFLEVFGRRNNLRNGWVTIGNQL